MRSRAVAVAIAASDGVRRVLLAPCGMFAAPEDAGLAAHLGIGPVDPADQVAHRRSLRHLAA